MSQLDIIIKEINKGFGENVINRASNFKNLNVESLSSGSYFLDWTIGKGFPKGKIIELYGIPSSGKSLIAAFTVAQTQKNGGECVWIDCENAFDPEFATKIGIDVKKLILSQSSVGEPTLDLIAKLLEGQPDIVVVDSVAAMIPKVDLEEPLEQPVMATRARMMSRGLAKLNTLNKKTLIIFINQLRTDIGTYGGPSITPGGRALGHYAAVRVEVRRGDFLERNKQRIGQVVKFKITKNKVGTPWKEGYFKFYYDGTVDSIDELVSMALINGKINVNGSFYDIAGQKFHGREALETELKNNKDFLEKFKKEII